jgi:hypothetical protein
VDDLLTRNDSRVVISCVAGTTTLTNVEQIGKINHSLEAKSSLANMSAADLLEGAQLEENHNMKGHELGSNWKNRELFEIEAEGMI